MTKIEVMYLCDRLAAWYADFAPYEEKLDSNYFWTQVTYIPRLEKLISWLGQTYEEMSVDNEDDERSFKELGSILEQLQALNNPD